MRINCFKHKIFLISTLLLLVFYSCDSREEYIPYAYVNFSVDLNINNNLATPGYSMLYHNEGYGGVIVYCEYYDYTAPGNSIFHAFDATCTYEVSDSCTITNDGNSFYGECPCCHSKYQFSTGYPVEGVATYPLQSYHATVRNNTVTIYN
jgi:hypothetical protein